MKLQLFFEEVTQNKTSWIQKLTKDELVSIHDELKLSSADCNLESLRKTLRDLVKSGKLASYISSHSVVERPPKENSDAGMFEDVPNYEIPKKMNYSHGNIEPFNGNNFELFEQQLECIITLNDIPEVKQTPLLLTKLTPKVLETLNHLCSPDKPIKKEYDQLLKLLENRYTKSTSTSWDRAAFRSRNQKPNEQIEDYIIELKKLAKRCDFKDMEDQVKEKFIEGVNKAFIKFELLKNGDVSLEKLISIARIVEAAMQQSNLNAQEYMEPNQFSESKRMFQVEKRKMKTYSGKTNTQKLNQNDRYSQNKKKRTCFVCGKDNYIKTECTLKNKFCSKCGKQGHIFRVCRLRQTKKVEAIMDSEMEVKNCWSLTAPS